MVRQKIPFPSLGSRTRSSRSIDNRKSSSRSPRTPSTSVPTRPSPPHPFQDGPDAEDLSRRIKIEPSPDTVASSQEPPSGRQSDPRIKEEERDDGITEISASEDVKDSFGSREVYVKFIKSHWCKDFHVCLAPNVRPRDSPEQWDLQLLQALATLSSLTEIQMEKAMEEIAKETRMRRNPLYVKKSKRIEGHEYPKAQRGYTSISSQDVERATSTLIRNHNILGLSPVIQAPVHNAFDRSGYGVPAARKGELAARASTLQIAHSPKGSKFRPISVEPNKDNKRKRHQEFSLDGDEALTERGYSTLWRSQIEQIAEDQELEKVYAAAGVGLMERKRRSREEKISQTTKRKENEKGPKDPMAMLKDSPRRRALCMELQSAGNGSDKARTEKKAKPEAVNMSRTATKPRPNTHETSLHEPPPVSNGYTNLTTPTPATGDHVAPSGRTNESLVPNTNPNIAAENRQDVPVQTSRQLNNDSRNPFLDEVPADASVEDLRRLMQRQSNFFWEEHESLVRHREMRAKAKALVKALGGLNYLREDSP